MKVILADKKMSDEDIMERLKEVVTSETECQAKLNKKAKSKRPREFLGRDQDISSKLIAAVEFMQADITNLKQAVAHHKSLQFYQ